MHEFRNFCLVLVLLGSLIMSVWLWVFPPTWGESMLLSARIFGLLVFVSCAIWLFYALKFEDKLPDNLRQTVGEMYYEADGLCFMPIIRVRGDQAELCLYYQNRYENAVEAVVHMKPPGDSFIIKPGWHDIHFAFKADGGDFGVIHQPIAVPRHLQGGVVRVQLAADSFYPRSHGACWRRREGMPVGTLDVDWGGNPLKIGVHEVTGEIELNNPTILHLPMPMNVNENASGREIWKQERILEGAVAKT